MIDETCVVEGCRLRDLHGRCTFERNRIDGRHPLACSYGQSATTVARELGDLGEWKLLQYKDGPIKATIRGKQGVVEVWGGRHAHEVWFIERGTKAESLLCKSWSVTDGSLRKAVERGCAMAGIQTRLEI